MGDGALQRLQETVAQLQTHPGDHVDDFLEAFSTLLKEDLVGNRMVRPDPWAVIEAMGRAYPLLLARDIEHAASSASEGQVRLYAWINLALVSGALSEFCLKLPTQPQIATAYSSTARARSKPQMQVVAQCITPLQGAWWALHGPAVLSTSSANSADGAMTAGGIASSADTDAAACQEIHIETEQEAIRKKKEALAAKQKVKLGKAHAQPAAAASSVVEALRDNAGAGASVETGDTQYASSGGNPTATQDAAHAVAAAGATADATGTGADPTEQHATTGISAAVKGWGLWAALPSSFVPGRWRSGSAAALAPVAPVSGEPTSGARAAQPDQPVHVVGGTHEATAGPSAPSEGGRGGAVAPPLVPTSEDGQLLAVQLICQEGSEGGSVQVAVHVLEKSAGVGGWGSWLSSTTRIAAASAMSYASSVPVTSALSYATAATAAAATAATAATAAAATAISVRGISGYVRSAVPGASGSAVNKSSSSSQGGVADGTTPAVTAISLPEATSPGAGLEAGEHTAVDDASTEAGTVEQADDDLLVLDDMREVLTGFGSFGHGQAGTLPVAGVAGVHDALRAASGPGSGSAADRSVGGPSTGVAGGRVQPSPGSGTCSDTTEPVAEYEQVNGSSTAPAQHRGRGTTVRLVVDPPPSLTDRELYERQGGQCAGCGCQLLAVTRSASSGWLSFQSSHATDASKVARRCQYTHALYCPECHHGQTAHIPALVLHNWDLTPQPVCCAAAEYLSMVAGQPLLCVPAANPGLYAKVPALAAAHAQRRQIAQQLSAVRAAGGALAARADRLAAAAGTRGYMLNPGLVDFWAMHDLGEVSKGPLSQLPAWLEGVTRQVAALASVVGGAPGGAAKT